MEQVGVAELSTLLQVPADQILLWPIYTDFDVDHQAQSNPKTTGMREWYLKYFFGGGDFPGHRTL